MVRMHGQPLFCILAFRESFSDNLSSYTIVYYNMLKYAILHTIVYCMPVSWCEGSGRELLLLTADFCHLQGQPPASRHLHYPSVEGLGTVRVWGLGFRVRAWGLGVI